MPESYEGQGVPEQSHLLRNVLLAVAAVYVILSVYFLLDMRSRVDKLETAQKEAAAENVTLLKKLGMTQSELKESTEALASKLGLTQKERAARAAELKRQQQASEEKLTEQQQQAAQKITAVSGDVAGVKTELGGAKTDIASTRSDLEATKKKLETALGDLGVQSGLIARTRDDLEVLKHKGDRNYFEFTLRKGSKPTPLSTVSLQLKKVDQKKGKFSLNVMADDRTIEKKDRTVNEPLQFYTGRDKMLYELVVFTADKNTITGYLSTPKGAPAPPTSN